MASNILELLGTVKPDGTISLDQKITVPPGSRVKVRVEPIDVAPPPTETLVEFLERTRREMEAAGSHFMNDAEVSAWIDELRADDDHIEKAYEQMKQEADGE
jgi:hypothetical protein